MMNIIRGFESEIKICPNDFCSGGDVNCNVNLESLADLEHCIGSLGVDNKSAISYINKMCAE